MSQMSPFPEFFVRSRSVKRKHHLSVLHFLPILMKITRHGACGKARRVSESVAKQYQRVEAQSYWLDVDTSSTESDEPVIGKRFYFLFNTKYGFTIGFGFL
ncbi:hypothetical protein AVEN_197904-1 [Araneus ventricosus]|uniref:Uncharacterized protein n=1 Tax=Araneus ventricosus TaxID=182803 RepID=A0A4Y2CJF7_ARAVE|nr:hypothetical protein AVEN_197904-1 [Araneus ventricosus]